MAVASRVWTPSTLPTLTDGVTSATIRALSGAATVCLCVAVRRGGGLAFGPFRMTLLVGRGYVGLGNTRGAMCSSLSWDDMMFRNTKS